MVQSLVICRDTYMEIKCSTYGLEESIVVLDAQLVMEVDSKVCPTIVGESRLLILVMSSSVGVETFFSQKLKATNTTMLKVLNVRNPVLSRKLSHTLLRFEKKFNHDSSELLKGSTYFNGVCVGLACLE